MKFIEGNRVDSKTWTMRQKWNCQTEWNSCQFDMHLIPFWIWMTQNTKIAMIKVQMARESERETKSHCHSSSFLGAGPRCADYDCIAHKPFDWSLFFFLCTRRSRVVVSYNLQSANTVSECNMDLFPQWCLVVVVNSFFFCSVIFTLYR